MAVIFLLLISTVFGILSADELERCAVEPVTKASNDVYYINPDGPLNLMCGYISRENRVMYKKRLYSPGLQATYCLKMEEGDSTFTRRGSNDISNMFKGGNKATSEYLFKYYRAVKEMYNVINGQVTIYVSRKTSLCKLLSEKHRKNNVHFKLLSALLLLAEGVDVSLEVKNVEILFKGKNILMPAVICKGGENCDKILFEIKLYTIMETKKENSTAEKQKKEDVHLHAQELKGISNLLKFYIAYGGKNRQKVDSYKLTKDDTPAFLIRSYIFEFIHDLEDSKVFFKVVNDLLIDTGNKRNSKTWKMFFTTDNRNIKKYDPVYKTLKKLDEIVSKIGFPFSIYNQPPFHKLVNGYNRNSGTIIDTLSFSDCCDISIYTLFCCLLYDPTSNSYSLEKMENNGYAPLKELKDFFRKFCKRPTRDTSYSIHQRWTRVVQDLLLREKALMGGQRPGKNMIRYRKTMVIDGKTVGAEIDTDILNILKVVAKVIGMPKEKKKELGKICEMVKKGKVSKDDIKKIIIEYATNIFSELSVMYIEVNIYNMEIEYDNEFLGVYGNITVTFSQFEYTIMEYVDHTVMFSLSKGHGCAEVITGNNRIKEEDKIELVELLKECRQIKLEEGPMVANIVAEFFSPGAFEQIPQEMVKKVEQAQNDMERYLAVNELLNKHRIATVHDKMYIIDLFAPYLYKMTSDNKNRRADDSNHNNVSSRNSQKPSSNLTKAKKHYELKPSDPVIQLISNIIGNVPLDDEAVQYLVFQIFSCCNGKYKSLFPNIQHDVKLISIFEPDSSYTFFNEYDFKIFQRHFVPNILNMLFNKLREEYGCTFYEEVFRRYDIFISVYLPFAKKCIAANFTALIEVIKKDFRIEGGIIKPDSTALNRLIHWFDITLYMEYYEMFVEVCENWESLFMKENKKFLLILAIRKIRRHTMEWNTLSKDVIKQLCENKRYERAIIEISLCTAYGSMELDKVYKLLISLSSIDLWNSIMSFIEDTCKDLQNYLTEMEDPSKSGDCTVKDRQRLNSQICSNFANTLGYFIRKIVDFTNAYDSSQPGQYNDEIIRVIAYKANHIIISLDELKPLIGIKCWY